MDVWNNLTNILLLYVLLSEVEGNVPAQVPEVILSLFVCLLLLFLWGAFFAFLLYFTFLFLFSMIISI